MDVRFGGAITVACCALSLHAQMVAGEPAPDLTVRDASGAPVKLSSCVDKKHVALLAPAVGHAADWADSIRRLVALDTVLLFQDGPASTVLIDRAGMVRRVLPGRLLRGAELADFVGLWQSGKAFFVAYCARCHGEDGDQTWCDPKPLTGVSRRLSADQIREILHAGEPVNDEVIIRGERVKKSQLEAILVYLAGL